MRKTNLLLIPFSFFCLKTFLWAGSPDLIQIEIPLEGISLTEPTRIVANQVILRGPLYTNGFKLVLFANKIVFLDSGKITSFKYSAMAGNTGLPGINGLPGKDQVFPATMGGEGEKGGKGQTGGKGEDGMFQPEKITIFSNKVYGNVQILGIGQEGGKGGKGGVGGRGGRGGMGSRAYPGCWPLESTAAYPGGFGGKGGDAGDGGIGGNGGEAINIIFGYGQHLASENYYKAKMDFQIISRSGEGGLGGEFGQFGLGGAGGPGGYGWAELCYYGPVRLDAGLVGNDGVVGDLGEYGGAGKNWNKQGVIKVETFSSVFENREEIIRQLNEFNSFKTLVLFFQMTMIFLTPSEKSHPLELEIESKRFQELLNEFKIIISEIIEPSTNTLSDKINKPLIDLYSKYPTEIADDILKNQQKDYEQNLKPYRDFNNKLMELMTGYKQVLSQFKNAKSKALVDSLSVISSKARDYLYHTVENIRAGCLKYQKSKSPILLMEPGLFIDLQTRPFFELPICKSIYTELNDLLILPTKIPDFLNWVPAPEVTPKKLPVLYKAEDSLDKDYFQFDIEKYFKNKIKDLKK